METERKIFIVSVCCLQHNAMKAVIDDLIEEFFKHWKRTSEDSESCSVKEFLKGIGYQLSTVAGRVTRCRHRFRDRHL